MKISIAKNVLEDPRWFPILDVALLIVEDGRHSIAVDQVADLFSSRWLAERGSDTRDLIRLTTTSRSVDALADQHTVVIDSTVRRGGAAGPDRSTLVHPLDAILFLSTPFQIIVENELFDGGFILWMAEGLGFTQLLSAYAKHRFTFRHAGGKGLILQSAKVFSESVWPRTDRSTDRAFKQWMCVVLDNDARDRDHDPNRKIIDDTAPHVIFVHQLQRGAIENYLSKEILLEIDSTSVFTQRVEALFRMTAEQQCYYHIKRGFRFQKNTEPTKANYMAADAVRPGQKALYGNVDDSDWHQLMYGFGRGISDMFVDSSKRPRAGGYGSIATEARTELLGLFRRIYESI